MSARNNNSAAEPGCLVDGDIPLHPPFRWAKFLPAGIVVITLVRLVVEGYRWQMVPAYILTAALFLLTLPSLLKNTNPAPARGALAFLTGGFGFLWLLIAGACQSYSGATSSDAARPRCGRFRLIRLDGHEASRNLFVRSEAMRRESARFQSVFVASSWFRQNGVLSSRPPVPCRGITPAVRRLNHRSNIDHNY